MKNSLIEINKMDRDLRKLSKSLNETKVLVGLEMANRLKEFKDHKLYKKIDDGIYDNFGSYLESLGASIYSVRDVISIYETYVCIAEIDIKSLTEYSITQLRTLKPTFFNKEDGEYVQLKTKNQIIKMLGETDILTQKDLRQKIREEEIGNHEHEFEKVSFKICKQCRLKEKLYV